MKRFFIVMLLAVSASTMMAQGSQQIITRGRSIRATLPEFSFNGQVQMFVKEDSDDHSSETIVFYGDDFSQQGTLTLPSVSYNYIYKCEERVWKDDGAGNAGFTGDWKVMREDNRTYCYGILTLYLRDFDQSCDDFRNIYLTQTLFNTDDKYEYLLPVFTTSYNNNELDKDGDGQIDVRSTETKTTMTGFKIMSETGSILQTVAFDNGFYILTGFFDGVDLLKINGKLYLCFEGYVDDSLGLKEATLIYTIDPNTSSVRMKTMDTVSASARYTLDGRRTNGEKGINIIRMEDGTVKKVFVK